MNEENKKGAKVMEKTFLDEQKRGLEIAEQNMARIPQAAEVFLQVADFIAKQKDFCPIGDIKIKNAHRIEECGVIELEGSFILRYEYMPQSEEPVSLPAPADADRMSFERKFKELLSRLSKSEQCDQ